MSAKSGHVYQKGARCVRPACTRMAPYGKRGFCQFHYGAYRNELRKTGQICALMGRVDASPVAAHINRLREAGVHMSDIARHSGLAMETLYQIPRQKTVNADTAMRITRIPPT